MWPCVLLHLLVEYSLNTTRARIPMRNRKGGGARLPLYACLVPIALSHSLSPCFASFSPRLIFVSYIYVYISHARISSCLPSNLVRQVECRAITNAFLLLLLLLLLPVANALATLIPLPLPIASMPLHHLHVSPTILRIAVDIARASCFSSCTRCVSSHTRNSVPQSLGDVAGAWPAACIYLQHGAQAR
jgi:hypothetical protein